MSITDTESGAFGNGPLRRIRRGRVIMGVAGGVADWLGMNRLVVRLVFFALGLAFHFLALVVYVVLGLLLDREERGEGERYDGGLSDGWNGRRRGCRDRSRRRREDRQARYAARDDADMAEDETPAEPGSVVARFRELERRLRAAEAEVTSPGFRIDRELKRRD
jgi:phage shock protein PspC (stress-responsive transcriptional regulator)